MNLQAFLIIPILLTACSAEEAAGTAGGSSVVEPGFLDSENGTDPLADATGTAQDPAPRQPLVPAPSAINQEYKPRRAAEFHFETDAVSDEQLAEFYVEMAVTVAGEDKGVMTFVMWPEKAPKSVRNFLRYCDEGYYDGLAFHRILRDFMMQGGSATNGAGGQGPHGNVIAEFSDERAFDHRYGVLSMARSGDPNSASSQFFVICGESQSTVGLNGAYSSFGMLVNGVSALEACASVPVGYGPTSREKSNPQQQVIMGSVVVKRGTPQETEDVSAPQPDLKGEAAKVVVQHILISMAGTPVEGVTRTKEEAALLAADILKRARDGEDFATMVAELTDDKASVTANPPGSYRMLNTGVFDYEAARDSMAIQKEAEAMRGELMEKVQSGEMTPQDAGKEFQTRVEGAKLMERLQATQWMDRGSMAAGFADLSFSLAVGEIGVAEYNDKTSPFGWHIIKRIQ